MQNLHFNALDLNLLRVFVALLEEGSATRAGARLGLSQSAVSHALGRLRDALGDPLFVRRPTGLEPTARAAEIGPAIRASLKGLETAVSPQGFDPAVDRRTFHISAGGYVCSVLMPAVVRRLLAEAPGLSLRISQIDDNLAEALDRGRIDLAIGAFEQVAPRFSRRPIFSETAVWVVRADHPVLERPVTPEALESLPLLTLTGGEGPDRAPAGRRDLALTRMMTWADDYALGATPISRAAGPVSAPDAFSALTIVAETDMVALLPRRLATSAIRKGRVAMIEPFRAAKPAVFDIVTRAGDEETGAIACLVDLIAEVARAL